MALPVGTSWSTIRQTRAMADNHYRFQTGDPLKSLMVANSQLMERTDNRHPMEPETTSKMSTSPSGWRLHRCYLLPRKSRTTVSPTLRIEIGAHIAWQAELLESDEVHGR